MSHPDESAKIGKGAWLALAAALLGWMFDGLEMGLFPLVAKPAITDLLGPDRKDDVGLWISIMYAVFLVGAATGGVVFGWLGDRIGRVRAMTLSVLTYAIFMGLCGISNSVHQMFVFRFISALGMGGEWSLGVALVMEIWPNRTRGLMAGLIGAAANVGFLAIAVVGLGLTSVIGSLYDWLSSTGLSQEWIDYLMVSSGEEKTKTGWRLLMLFGAAPALLTFFIRLAVPESERWLHAKAEKTTSHWAAHDMLAIVIGGIGPLAMIYLWSQNFTLVQRVFGSLAALAVAVIGYTYPVLRYMQRLQASATPMPGSWNTTIGRMLLGACLSGVPLIGTWASIQNAPSWADQLVGKAHGDSNSDEVAAAKSAARSWTQIWSALGAIIGTIAAALTGQRFGRRLTYSLLCIGSLLSSLAFFQLNTSYSMAFLLGVFVAGGLTASFYGWLPLYLPELFPTTVRATCQGFAFNFGRILGAVGALQTGFLMKDVFHGDFGRACSIMSLVYLVGLVVIWFAPETRGQPLPD
jgi:MFS family permease